MPLAIYCAILNQRLDKAILLAVFPPLGFKISLVLWGILEILGVIICLLLFRRLIPAGLPIQVLFTALLLSSFSLLHNLTWGQVGIFTLAAILGMLVLDQAARPLPAAILLALAASFKFYPLIFLIPFAARRDFRFLIYAAAACVALLFLIPGILLGFGDTLRFYGALLDAYRQFDWVVTNYNSQHFPHVLLRLAQAIGYDAMAFLPLLRWIGFGIAAANMGLIFLVQRTRLAYADLWSFQLTFLTIPFVLTTSWPVDLVYLAFAQSFLAWWLSGGIIRVDPAAGAAPDPRTPPPKLTQLASKSGKARSLGSDRQERGQKTQFFECPARRCKLEDPFHLAFQLSCLWRCFTRLTIPQRAALIIPLATFPVIYYVVACMPGYRLPIDWILLLLVGAVVWGLLERNAGR